MVDPNINLTYFRDISFLYDAKVITDRSKPLVSLSRSRDAKTAAGDHGMKTPGIEVT